jgi:hypothetical protein
MVIWRQCISSITRRISGSGQGAPAMMPVRKDRRSSKRAKSGWSSIAWNIVGTPCTAAQRSASMAASVSPASKASPGKTIVAP